MRTKLCYRVIIFFIPFSLVLPSTVKCQTAKCADSAKIEPAFHKPFHLITNVPFDISQIFRSPFQKDNRKGLIITAGSTAFLAIIDQPITDAVKKICKKINFSPETNYKSPIHFGKTNVLKVPQNLTSAFYQLGEGGTSMILAGGLFVYGKANHSTIAIATASDLSETFITMGITTQILKRITGRESPSNSTDEGGVWRPLPSFKQFQNNTPNYDSYPSGHLATMMATVTTLAMNYPTKKWIKRIGYALMGLTGVTMINADVHWISDYPLAIALGYVSAKITHLKNHPKHLNNIAMN